MRKRNAWMRYVSVADPRPASDLLQKLKENARNLRIRPDDFENILVGIGFSPARHLGTTGEGGGLVPAVVWSYSHISVQASGAQWTCMSDFKSHCHRCLLRRSVVRVALYI